MININKIKFEETEDFTQYIGDYFVAIDNLLFVKTNEGWKGVTHCFKSFQRQKRLTLKSYLRKYGSNPCYNY